MRPLLAVSAAATCALTLLTGCSSTHLTAHQLATAGPAPAHPAAPEPAPQVAHAPTWARPVDQFTQVARAGLKLTSTEQLTVHYHAHLDVTVDGQPITVPGGLGINAPLTGDGPPLHGAPGIAPLHTHDTSGVLHIEAPAAATFTLGQVFTEWGQVLQPGRVGSYIATGGRAIEVYVNGRAVSGDPAKVALRPHEEIAVEVTTAGQPKAKVPTRYAFPAGA